MFILKLPLLFPSKSESQISSNELYLFNPSQQEWAPTMKDAV